MCGQACARAQTGNSIEYDEVPYVQIVNVKADLIFDEAVCRVV